MNENKYNPDVLSCLANLSNDEVFTSPNVVNNMLDMLPKELFESKETTFLDIGTKSGVFLREIAKRLIKGLESKIPDLQERVDHILHKQLFGIATTELTSLVSRRTLYCSKYPNCRYSASLFDTVEGNIRFRAKKHDFVNGRCKWCGASAAQFDRDDGLESHAYEFIHTDKPEEIFNMKFDVIVGNPPYQMSDGGGTGSSATPIYQLFVEQAKKLNPSYLVMIIPSRWFSGGKGLDGFRDMMLHDKRIRHIVDYFDSQECFPGIDLSGGVCYFLWDANSQGDCIIENRSKRFNNSLSRPLLEKDSDSFIRFNSAVSIIRKVKSFDEKSFAEVVSSRRPFAIDVNEKIYDEGGYGLLQVFAYPRNGYIKKCAIGHNHDWVKKVKVMIAKAYGERGDFPYHVLGVPFIAGRETCCTETYLVVGPFLSQTECNNVVSYIKTRFFRFLVLQKKNTQNAARGVYQFVPMQDFSKPWSDEELYKKYKLTKEEIAFIESMIKPME